MRHYCHNCGHHGELADNVYCAWCLSFFYGNGSLPLKTDKPKPADTLSRIKALMGWT